VVTALVDAVTQVFGSDVTVPPKQPVKSVESPSHVDLHEEKFSACWSCVQVSGC